MAAEEGQVIACHTTEAWTEQLQKGNDSKKLVFFLFFLSYFYVFWILFLNVFSD